MPKRFLFIVMLVLLSAAKTAVLAQETPNERQACRIFNQAFNHVFHSEGCAFNYDVNIIGIYKTQGRMWMAGKESHFEESRYMGWSDDRTSYRVDKKKKTIEIHNAHSPKRDKYASKFQFRPDDYTYHIADGGSTYIFSLQLKKSGHSTIKQIKAVVTKHGLSPVSIKCKVYFFWCTVKISNFYSGPLNKNILTFNRSKFPGYKLMDKRPD